MEDSVYLDHNATTPVAPEVIESMLPFMKEQWGNPSSLHHKGHAAKRAVDRARDQVAEFLGAADSSEIIFTASGTESNNLALRGAAKAARNPVSLIHSTVEHSAVLEPVSALVDDGFSATAIPVNESGKIDFQSLKNALAEHPTLASFMWANNETGIIFPVAEMAEAVKNAGGIFHTDAVQAAGKLPINLQEIPVDLLSISGHKLYAPKGVGALFVRRGTRLKTQLAGGHQERGRRGGTENVPFIVGLGTACALAQEKLEEDGRRELDFRNQLESGLKAVFEQAEIVGKDAERLPNTSNICFRHLEGEALLLMMDDQGICVSTGAACESGSIEPSHVLKAMQVPLDQMNGAIRFSIGRYTTQDDIDAVLDRLPPILNRLKELSPKFK